MIRCVCVPCDSAEKSTVPRHISTHTKPATPVTIKALRQPYASAIGVTISGVMIAPSEPPLYATAIPRDCCFAGSQSMAVRKPPGNVAPSPNPRIARATAKPRKPERTACAPQAIVHMVTAIVMPRRRPMRSRIAPHIGFPSMYAKLNALTISPYFSAFSFRSARIIGESTARICRSM